MSNERSRRAEMLSSVAEAMANEDEEEIGADYRRPSPPREPSQVYSVRVPIERLEELRRLATREGSTPSALVRRLVIEGLERLEDRSSAMEVLQDRVSELEEQDARRQKEVSETVREVSRALSSLMEQP